MNYRDMIRQLKAEPNETQAITTEMVCQNAKMAPAAHQARNDDGAAAVVPPSDDLAPTTPDPAQDVQPVALQAESEPASPELAEGAELTPGIPEAPAETSCAAAVATLPEKQDVGVVSEAVYEFVEKAIKVCSRAGDLVLGLEVADNTLARVAAALGRRFLGILAPQASQLHENGLPCSPVKAEDACSVLKSVKDAGWVTEPPILLITDLHDNASPADDIVRMKRLTEDFLDKNGYMACRVSAASLDECLRRAGGGYSFPLADGSHGLIIDPHGPSPRLLRRMTGKASAAPGAQHSATAKESGTKAPQAISLFCGAGGIDSGFHAAGWITRYAVDFDPEAIATFKANHPGVAAEVASVRGLRLPRIKDLDTIFGGPPCQDFSPGGKRKGLSGKNGPLIWSFASIIEQVLPRSFLFENVDDFDTQFPDARAALIARFEAAGYVVTKAVLNSADFGVPQTRERLFIVGIRKDLGVSFDFASVQRAHEVVTQHEAFHHMQEWALPPSRRGAKITGDEFGKNGFSKFYLKSNRVRRWDQPAFTALAGDRNTPLHPEPVPEHVVHDSPIGLYCFHPRTGTYHRHQTPREQAATQSFPPDFQWRVRNLKAAYRVIGNAVPPAMAKALAMAIKEKLAEAEDLAKQRVVEAA
ncbi:MAG: hypothetical protein VR70_08090 [Rhodospirillaceae bacterium BRH_c57]|nr:MAG: hypothetical protein VR70_08090 [Rhodospirillaceae bacterium BRH_c57]